VERELPAYKFNCFEEDGGRRGEEKAKFNFLQNAVSDVAKDSEVDRTWTAHGQERRTYRGLVEKCEEKESARKT
jgi:hypothetical protein